MNNDYHWHWWHWLLIIVVTFIVLGIGYTWIKNYDIVRTNDQSYVNGTKQVIEHPIQSTENAINDMINK